MSHFTVAVITDGVPTNEKIEKALAPYQENNMGDCPKEYLEFHSRREEILGEYERYTRTMYRGEYGTLYRPDEEMFKKEIAYSERNNYRNWGYDGKKYYTSDYTGYTAIEIPHKQIYATFEEYLKEYCKDEWNEEAQDYGYWENPNAKWDWYEIGGRWAGRLKVASDCENCGVGKKSWGWGNEDPYESTDRYKKVDSARIKELVFPDYQEKYIEAKRFWELKVEKQEPQNDKEKELIKWDFYKPEYYINTYKDKETYAECEATFSTYAVIDKEGHWCAKGEMGWWGFSSSEENQEVDFIKNYKKNVFDVAGEDDYITIVDCHI